MIIAGGLQLRLASWITKFDAARCLKSAGRGGLSDIARVGYQRPGEGIKIPRFAERGPPGMSSDRGESAGRGATTETAMRRYIWAISAALLVTGAACDDSDSTPEAVRAQAQRQQREQRQAALATTHPTPTTQELMKEPRRPLKLGAFPLVVDAPASWKVGSLFGSGQILALQGPATSGDVAIQLIEQGPLVVDKAIDLTFESAKREAASKPLAVNRVELRPLGPGKVLEQRMLSGGLVNGHPPEEVWGESDTGIRDPQTGQNMTTRSLIKPVLLKWNFTVFLPAGEGKWSVRSLNFMSLRLAEYEQDREFLDQLMGSLRYQE